MLSSPISKSKTTKNCVFTFAMPVRPTAHPEIDRALAEDNRSERELFGEDEDEEAGDAESCNEDKTEQSPGSRTPAHDPETELIPEPPTPEFPRDIKRERERESKTGALRNACADQASRATATPVEPTKEERDSHLSHMPFKNWCQWCVRCKSPNARYMRVTKNGRHIPLFCADDCFPRDRQDATRTTVLAAAFIQQGARWQLLACKKGRARAQRAGCQNP